MITFEGKNHRGTGKPFVAKITGTHPTYKFAREFLPNPCSLDVQPGEIYQERDTDSNMRRTSVHVRDTYYLIERDPDGTLAANVIDESTAYRLASKL